MTTPITQPALDAFFDGLHVRLEAARLVRQELDRYLASGFNLFDALWPDENRVSSLLARLLDPSGGHGQGALFLASFCDLLRPATALAEPATLPDGLDHQRAHVQTEVATRDARRIDIVVRYGTHFAIGIENKPWAGDQPQQLEDYHHHLDCHFDRHLLVYLSGNGGAPSEASISPSKRQELESQGRLVTLAYNPGLKTWLEEVALRCEAEKVRWYVRDLAAWVERNFPNAESHEGV